MTLRSALPSLGLAVSALAASTAAAGQTAEPVAGASARSRSVSVVGRGSVALPPDLASVRIGVSNRAATPAAALDATSASARRVIEIAKEAGVAPNEIGTGSVSLQPAFRTGGGGAQTPDGYRAENSVEVRLRDLDRLGDLMRRALDGGANTIAGVTFELSDPAAAERRAATEAVGHASATARALAEAAGAKLGPVWSIAAPPRTEMRPVAASMRAMAAPPPRGRVPLEAGVVEVVAEVEITWSLEPRDAP